jgi:predicted  nucleic acid-binding Zn-ribbon protein
MGFFDKLLGSGKPVVQVEKLEFSELSQWLESQKRGLVGGEDRAQLFSDELPGAISSLKKRLDELEKSKISRDVPQRVIAIVSSSRDNYAHKIRRIIEGLGGGDAIELSDILNASLSELKETDLKYGERVNYGFPDELGKVKKELNRIVSISDSLNRLLGERKTRLNQLKDIENCFEETNRISKNISELKERRRAEEKELSAAKEEMASKEKEINKMASGESARKIAAIEAELEELGRKKQELVNYVLNTLGPLRRVFKKYSKAVKDGKASGINVEKYADDPVSTYLWGEHTLPELLPKMMKAVQTGLLGLDSAESEKSLKKMRAISFSYLEKARSEHNSVVGKIRSLELQIRELSVSDEIEKLKREVGGANSKIASLEKRIEKLDDEIEVEKSKLEEVKKDLENKIASFTGGQRELA